MAIESRSASHGARAIDKDARPRQGISVLARLTAGGTDGNEQLTALTGAVLLVLLAVLGITILRVRQLLEVHMFLGMLLIAPVALKMASTGYRFIRYYSSEPHYRRKGPPALALRLLAPLVVISTVVVFASGVILLFAGPSSRNALLPIHKVSFIVWGVVTGVHVLGHIADLPGALRAEKGFGKASGIAVLGRTGRIISLTGVLVAGIVIAILVLPQFGPWMNSYSLFHH
jgi:hypothetical protein